jgi:hypothetical protein
MRKAYLRESKLYPLDVQRRGLEHAGFMDWGDMAPVYVDAKPKRADAGWSWREEVIRSCRPGEGDEVWIAFAGVWAGSAAAALDALKALAERGAALVVAETGARYQWHPDAVSAIELAHAIEAENKRKITRKATLASMVTAERKRRAKAARWKEAKEMWLHDKTLTGDEVASRTGFSRSLLHRSLGARGTPRFVKPKKEST